MNIRKKKKHNKANSAVLGSANKKHPAAQRSERHAQILLFAQQVR